jgi:hypothetical protein
MRHSINRYGDIEIRGLTFPSFLGCNKFSFKKTTCSWRAALFVIITVAIIGFLVVRMVKKANKRTEERVFSEILGARIGAITPQLVLGAAIPLKPNRSIKGAYADSLARHVKIYLQQNPRDAEKYIDLIEDGNGDDPETLLDFEMMLEHSQHIRKIILRAVLTIKQVGNWEFCSAIDEPRLVALVSAQEADISGVTTRSYFSMGGDGGAQTSVLDYDPHAYTVTSPSR